MQKTVEQQIRAKITHSRYGAVFFASTFPQFDVEHKIKKPHLR